MNDGLDQDAYARVLRSVRLVKAQLPEIVDMLRPLWKPETGEPASLDATIKEILTVGRPVRRIVGKSRVRRSGYFASRKNAAEGPIAWESELEKHALWLLECDPDVERFITQPMTITYVLDGKERRHTPDIWCWRGGRSYVIEIKPAWRLQRPYVDLRTRVVTELFRRFGIEYLIWRDDQIQREPRLSNMKYLLRFRDQAITAKQKWIVRAFLERQKTASILDVGAQIGPNGRDVVFAMLQRGQLLFDRDEPISLKTRVWLRSRGNK